MKFLLSTIMFCWTTVYGLSGMSELEKQMDQVRIMTPNDTCGANTALARPILNADCGCCGANFFLSASALYWHPKVAGTEFAYSITNFNPGTVVPMKGCLTSIDFRWNWGLRAGLGYNFAHDGWDIFLEYTWFTSRGSQSLCGGANNSTVALRGLPIIAQADTETSAFLIGKKAVAHFCLAINALKLELGRAFYVSEYLALHPKVGLKAGWIGLGQHAHYVTMQENGVRVKDCNRFAGIGPHFGLGTEWHFCGDFYFYGDIYGCLMYGHFNVHHKERFSLAPCSNLIRLCQMRHAFVPEVGSHLGLGYSTYCGCDNMHLRLRLGFDAKYVWRINQMIEVKDVSALRFGRISEDLSIHGVSLDIRLDF